jgi:putative selenium metabolism hydrolase
MKKLNLLTPKIESELIDFAQHLVRIKSVSGDEEKIIRFIEKKMREIGYDEVTVDSMGNVVGKIGSGKNAIMFDSHIDTVDVKNEREWGVPPFSGKIVDGKLWGRGSADMKSGAAASIYAGAVAKNAGLDSDTAIYVSCTVMEEDCDGENLKHVFKELTPKPIFVIICEPSDNKISLGHKGKAQISLKTHGVSAHGSAPEKGVNAIYEMAEIIQRVEKCNERLMKKDGPKGTLVMSNISSKSVSLNAVPSECEAYMDRRMVPGETENTIRREMDGIIKGKKATWEVGNLNRRSWTGMNIQYEPFHLAWKIDEDHELTIKCVAAYRKVFGCNPDEFEFWDFSTNGVTPVGLGIPTIGFGPGEYKLAHMRNENCKIHQIVDACNFYTQLAISIEI